MLPLIYLVFGIIQYGLYFYSYNSGTQVVGDAVRRLSVGDCENGELPTYLLQHLGAATTDASLTPTVTYTDADGTAMAAPGEVGGSVTVKLTFSALDMHFPFIPLPDGGDVTRTQTARIEDTVSSGSCAGVT